MNGKTLAKLLSVALVAVAVFASGAFAHGGNNDPNAIHACVNRFGEVRILGFQGLSIDGPCPLLGGPWAIVHWGIVGPSGPSGASGPSGPSGPPGPTEGVNAHGTGVTPPTTLTNQWPFLPSTSASQFTTTVTGKLHLTKTFGGYLECPTASAVWWWIVLDGTPVRGSLMLAVEETETTPYTIVGVTDSVIPAATHTMHIEGMCTSGAGGPGAGGLFGSSGTAIVLGG